MIWEYEWKYDVHTTAYINVSNTVYMKVQRDLQYQL